MDEELSNESKLSQRANRNTKWVCVNKTIYHLRQWRLKTWSIKHAARGKQLIDMKMNAKIKYKMCARGVSSVDGTMWVGVTLITSEKLMVEYFLRCRNKIEDFHVMFSTLTQENAPGRNTCIFDTASKKEVMQHNNSIYINSTKRIRARTSGMGKRCHVSFFFFFASLNWVPNFPYGDHVRLPTRRYNHQVMSLSSLYFFLSQLLCRKISSLSCATQWRRDSSAKQQEH